MKEACGTQDNTQLGRAGPKTKVGQRESPAGQLPVRMAQAAMLDGRGESSGLTSGSATIKSLTQPSATFQPPHNPPGWRPGEGHAVASTRQPSPRRRDGPSCRHPAPWVCSARVHKPWPRREDTPAGGRVALLVSTCPHLAGGPRRAPSHTEPPLLSGNPSPVPAGALMPPHTKLHARPGPTRQRPGGAR